MTTSAQTKPTKPATATTGTEEAQSSAAPAGRTQVFYVPDYNVSVEAASQEEAVAKAKKLKGVK